LPVILKTQGNFLSPVHSFHAVEIGIMLEHHLSKMMPAAIVVLLAKRIYSGLFIAEFFNSARECYAKLHIARIH